MFHFYSNNPMKSEGKLWPAYSREFPLYATLNSEDSRIGYGPRAMHCAFWNEMIPLISKHELKMIQGIVLLAYSFLKYIVTRLEK